MPDKTEFSDSEAIYLKQKDVARLLGLSTRQIQRLTDEGVFERQKTTSGTKGYELYGTVHGYLGYLATNENAKNSQVRDKEIDLKEQKLKAEIALKESQAELHELKTGIEKGEYIAVDEIRLDYDRFCLNFKKFAMGIPTKVGGMITGIVDAVTERQIEHDLSQEITDQLTAFVLAARTGEEDGEKKAGKDKAVHDKAVSKRRTRKVSPASGKAHSKRVGGKIQDPGQ
jgi:phage terminase Nu1 subunit (DNA packaging protein)